MADTAREPGDLAVLAGIAASLEGYFRLGDGDPTGRARALKQLARRAAADLTRELGLTDSGSDPGDPGAVAAALAAELARGMQQIAARLRAELAAVAPVSD